MVLVTQGNNTGIGIILRHPQHPAIRFGAPAQANRIAAFDTTGAGIPVDLVISHGVMKPVPIQRQVFHDTASHSETYPVMISADESCSDQFPCLKHRKVRRYRDLLQPGGFAGAVRVREPPLGIAHRANKN